MTKITLGWRVRFRDGALGIGIKNDAARAMAAGLLPSHAAPVWPSKRMAREQAINASCRHQAWGPYRLVRVVRWLP